MAHPIFSEQVIRSHASGQLKLIGSLSSWVIYKAQPETRTHMQLISCRKPLKRCRNTSGKGKETKMAFNWNLAPTSFHRTLMFSFLEGERLDFYNSLSVSHWLWDPQRENLSSISGGSSSEPLAATTHSSWGWVVQSTKYKRGLGRAPVAFVAFMVLGCTLWIHVKKMNNKMVHAKYIP